jgi:hypothetical protein
MTGAVHTPGPWLAASKPSSVVGWPVVGELGTLIADVSTMSFPGQPIPKEALANARLIAAAPELLEDGADLLASLDPDTLNPEQFNAWCALQAAIAKARGERA